MLALSAQATKNSNQYQLTGAFNLIYFVTFIETSKPTTMKNVITLWLAFLLLAGFSITQNTATAQTSRELLMVEEFNYPDGQLPPGWVLDGAQAPWKVSNTNYGFGTAPELMLGYSFASGLSRLISTPIDITGHQNLKLKYRQYLINYEMDWGEIIGVDVTFDGGTSWQTLWERPLGILNIEPDFVEYYINAPSGSTQFQYAFRYEGNNNAINMWLIDDVTLETVLQNELLTASFTGNIAPAVGNGSTYSVEVINGGSASQSAYTVKLMMEGGVELASVAGEPIAFAEKQTYDLTWTPSASQLGNTFIYASIDFTGDENPSNNQTTDRYITVQPENIDAVAIGKDFIPVSFLPYNMFNLYSMTQTLYFPDEIGMNGDTIVAIGYTGHFDQFTPGVHLQIMLGETTNTQLMDAWIEPATLTPVFDGMVDFHKGLNDVYIQLDQPYKYNGQNLVVHSVKGFANQLFLTPFICSYDSNSFRSRAAERDDQPWDPNVLPEWGYSIDTYPNITLYYAADPTGVKEQSNANINIYPNPATDMLNIISDETIQHIKIINTLGQVVYSESVGAKHYQINVAPLTKGIYLVQLTTPSGMNIQKLQR